MINKSVDINNRNVYHRNEAQFSLNLLDAMKKVIYGKLYNTDSAKEISSWHNNAARNDFHWCSEVLYITEKGNYFLVGQGGPRSPYTQSVPGGGISGSKELIALSEQEAYDWCERRDQVRTIEDYFADYIESA